MYKIIFAFYLALALTKAEFEQLETYQPTYDYKYLTDDYISLYRQRHNKVIQDYNKKIDYLREHYADRVKGINMIVDLLTATIMQVEASLDPMETLSEFNKNCVTKHRTSIPSVLYVQNETRKCAATALHQIDTLVTSPLKIKTDLLNYYAKIFEEELETCHKNHTSEESYFKCIYAVIEKANDNIVANQKEFEYALEAAECNAKINIKRTIDCSYTVQSDATSKIAEANLLISNCLTRIDECKPCKYSCIYSWELLEDELHNKTIMNPFFERKGIPKCLMLTVKQFGYTLKIEAE